MFQEKMLFYVARKFIPKLRIKLLRTEIWRRSLSLSILKAVQFLHLVVKEVSPQAVLGSGLSQKCAKYLVHLPLFLKPYTLGVTGFDMMLIIKGDSKQAKENTVPANFFFFFFFF